MKLSLNTFLIAGIVFLALLVRLPLFNGSFWLDEAAQALESTRPLSQQFNIAYDFQPPLFHLVVHFFSRVNLSEWFLRLASLIPGLASIGLIVTLGRKHFGRDEALLGGLLVAVSSLHVFLSQELRPYIFSSFFVLISFFSFLEILTQEKTSFKGWSFWGFLFGNLLAWFSSYVSIFIAPAYLLISLFYKRGGKVFSLLSVAFLWWMAWFPGFWQQWIVGHELGQTLPAWRQVVSPPFMKAVFLVLAKFLVGVSEVDPNLWFTILIGVPYILFIISLGHMAFQSKLSKNLQVTILFSLIVFGLVSIVTIFTPIMAPKRVIFLLPLLFIIIASLGKSVKVWGQLLLASFLIWQVISLSQYWTQARLQRENWKEALEQIETHFSPEDTVIVFAFDDSFAPWRWYVKESFATRSTGLEPLESRADVSIKIGDITQYDKVVVFDYLRDLTDPNKVIEGHLQELGYEELGFWQYPGIGAIRTYQKEALYALIKI